MFFKPFKISIIEKLPLKFCKTVSQLSVVNYDFFSGTIGKQEEISRPLLIFFFNKWPTNLFVYNLSPRLPIGQPNKPYWPIIFMRSFIKNWRVNFVKIVNHFCFYTSIRFILRLEYFFFKIFKWFGYLRDCWLILILMVWFCPCFLSKLNG